MQGEIGRWSLIGRCCPAVKINSPSLSYTWRSANFAHVSIVCIPDEMSAMGRSLIGSSNRLVAVASMFVIVGQFGFNGGDMRIVWLRRIVVDGLPQSWRNGVLIKYWRCYPRKLLITYQALNLSYQSSALWLIEIPLTPAIFKICSKSAPNLTEFRLHVTCQSI